MSKILGIDYGDRRIGLAIGDLETRTAVPYQIINQISEQQLIDELKEIIKKEKINEMVLGLPLSMSGQGMRQEDQANEHLKKYLAFKKILEKELGLPIISEDERLSTKMARSLRGRKSKEKCDDVAAMLILQSYLDRRSNIAT